MTPTGGFNAKLGRQWANFYKSMGATLEGKTVPHVGMIGAFRTVASQKPEDFPLLQGVASNVMKKE